METTAPDAIGTELELLDLLMATTALAEKLKVEGRHVAAMDVQGCVDMLAFAFSRYDQIANSHD